MEVERTFENGSGALMSEIDLANMSDDEIFGMLCSGREESTLRPLRPDKSGIVAMEVERTFENRSGALMSEIDLANMSDDEIFGMLCSGREESTLCPLRPGALMSEIDDASKGEDGFLHMTYSGGEEKGIVEYDAQMCDLILGEVVKKKRREIKGGLFLSKGIVMLDTWNDPLNKEHMAQLEEKAALKGKSAAELSTIVGKDLWEKCQEREINPWVLRKKKPDHIPVNVKKDPSSKIPDIWMKKFQVHFDLPLSEFIEFIRFHIEWKEGWKWTKPLFLYFKNTDPPAGTSMYVIDKENKDDDGFLNITYSGEEKGAWTQLNNEEFALKVKI